MSSYGFATMRDVQRIARTVIHSERMLRGSQGSASTAPNTTSYEWFNFKNVSAFEVPSFGVIELTGFEAIGQGLLGGIFNGDRPSATWRGLYGVNSGQPVAAGDYGRFCVGGNYHVAYDTGTPAIGEGWGIKPGSFLLSKGYPQFVRVHGVVDSDEKWLDGTIQQPTTLLCKATTDLSVGSVSTNFKIWKGTKASGADAGFTTLPAIEIGAPYKTDDYFVAHYVNGGWISGYPSKSVTVVTDYQVDTGTNKLQKKTRAVYVLSADAESSWTDVHAGVDCEDV